MKSEDRKFFVRQFSSFVHFDRNKLLFIVLLTILFAFTQGIGYMMIIPLLGLLKIDRASENSVPFEFFSDSLRSFHIEISLELVLVAFVIIVSSLFLLQNRKAVVQSSFQHSFSGYLRKKYYKQILFSSWQNLTRISKASHMQSLISEIPRATHFYFYMLQAFTKVIIICIHFILALIISWKISLIIVSCGIVQFWLLSGFFRKSYEYGRTGRKTFRRILKNIDDFWMAVKPAKAHHSEEFYMKNFSKADDDFTANQINQFVHHQRPQLLYKLLGLINMVFLILVAQYFFSVQVSSLIVLVLLFGRILPLFINTYQDINQMYLNAESLKSIQNLQNQNVSVNVVTDKPLFSGLNAGITLNEIHFSYVSDKPVFQNFSAFIPVHKITGITGESGCGKTTLADIISGLLIPDVGKVMYDQLDINQIHFKHISNRISYLPQDSLFIDGTVRDNLIWDTPHQYSDTEIEQILEKVNAKTFLKNRNINLNSDIHQFRYNFSGGELQRLAIARALLRKPVLLILDEATSALDSVNEDIILKYLKDISSFTTIILISHKSSLLKICDHIINL